MTNKELNMAILSKLYEIAEMIWQKMVRNDHGCFRASEIAKNLGKIFYWDEADKDELIQIEVGSFRCAYFPSCYQVRESCRYRQECAHVYLSGGGR